MNIKMVRIGMFYETFNEDAIETICAVLPLHRTKTRSGLPIVGFPVWEKQFIVQLEQAGHTVEITNEKVTL